VAISVGAKLPSPKSQSHAIYALLMSLLPRISWRLNSSKSNRISIVSQFYPPDFAATGQLIHDLAHRIATDSCQVQIITGMPSYAFNVRSAKRVEIGSNVCVRRSNASRFFPRQIRGRAVNGVLFCLRVFVKLLRSSRRGDLIVYTSEPPYLPFVGYLVFLLTRTPFLLILYDLYPDVLSQLRVLHHDHWLVRMWCWLNSRLFESSSEIIVLSDAMKRRILSTYQVRDESVSVITSWCDPTFIKPVPKSENPFAIRYGLTDRYVVMYSGNHGRCHDLSTAIGAAILLKEDPSILFVFIGAGHQKPIIERLAQQLNLQNCLFLPYQDLSDLPFSLASADLSLVTLAPDADHIVAPSKLYGHLSAATPVAVVSSRMSYVRTLVQENGIGCGFDNGNVHALSSWIKQLSLDPDLQASYSANALRYLQQNATPDIIVNEYKSVFSNYVKFSS